LHPGKDIWNPPAFISQIDPIEEAPKPLLEFHID